jgi:hypothetical protein
MTYYLSHSSNFVAKCDDIRFGAGLIAGRQVENGSEPDVFRVDITSVTCRSTGVLSREANYLWGCSSVCGSNPIGLLDAVASFQLMMAYRQNTLTFDGHR